MNIQKIMSSLEAKHPGELAATTINILNLKKPKSSKDW